MALDRVVALVDMDCFYVQVEQRSNPTLKGKPCAVVQYKKWKGGGIIAVSYEACACGVTRQMRGDDAKAKCPQIQLVHVPEVRGKADLTKFREAGAEVIEVLSQFGGCVERASVDEAYIDLTEEVERKIQTCWSDGREIPATELPNTFVVGYEYKDQDSESDPDKCRRVGMAEWLSTVEGGEDLTETDRRLAVGAIIVEEMRAAVYTTTGFRCSAGIAHNKQHVFRGDRYSKELQACVEIPDEKYWVCDISLEFFTTDIYILTSVEKMLAKLACGLHKPNKQTVLPHSSVRRLFQTMPIRKVRHFGGKFGDNLTAEFGVEHMGDLCQFPLKVMQEKLGDKSGSWVFEVCRGIEYEPVLSRQLAQSIGCSKNFTGRECLNTKEKVKFWLNELSKELEERLIKDKENNKRVSKHLTVYIRQASGSQSSSASRSVGITQYDAEKIAEDCFAVLSKLNNAPAHSASWLPPAVNIGMSAGKFEDLSTTGTSSIKNFFSVGNSPAASQDHVLPASQQTPSQKRGVKRKSGPLQGLFLNMEKANQTKQLKVEAEGASSNSYIAQGTHEQECKDGGKTERGCENELCALGEGPKKTTGKVGFFASLMQKRQKEEITKSMTNNMHVDSNDMVNFVVDQKKGHVSMSDGNSRQHSNGSVDEKRFNTVSVSSLSVLAQNEYRLAGNSSHDTRASLSLVSNPCATSSDQNGVHKTSQNTDHEQPSTSSGRSEFTTEAFAKSELCNNPSAKEYFEEQNNLNTVNTSDNLKHYTDESNDCPLYSSANNTENSSVENSKSFSAEDYMQCPKCEQIVLVWEMPEHSDFHFAMEIQAEQSQNAPQCRKSTSATETPTAGTGNDGKKRGRPKKEHSGKNTPSVLNFFVKNS